MNLTDLHRRLLADVLAVGGAYPLALTGDYAVQPHGLVERLSHDLDVATKVGVLVDQRGVLPRSGATAGPVPLSGYFS
ncbi:hypothetical protein P8A22_20795 [Streptomyces laculatispora]|uniref:Uncharacterized protein n=1 Tax=Streptomyces laculatispora TaxID=887464 RepID=A0ABY9IHN9_9ACTN|nr:hypothetical protein [Streptomyces laculatispora]WLQ45582.1 hypothetical protein P8A22_20795 [Streptomyces laculatispora]